MKTALGYTHEQVDSMTFPQLKELLDYWVDFPPTHELMRMTSGYKPPDRVVYQKTYGATGLDPNAFKEWAESKDDGR